MPSKFVSVLLCFAALASSTSAAPDLPAFPGAEGFGRLARGGRGGDVYHALNLNDAWELAHGLDPKDSNDRNADRAGDGYTNLEAYLKAKQTGSGLGVWGEVDSIAWTVGA